MHQYLLHQLPLHFHLYLLFIFICFCWCRCGSLKRGRVANVRDTWTMTLKGMPCQAPGSLPSKADAERHQCCCAVCPCCLTWVPTRHLTPIRAACMSVVQCCLVYQGGNAVSTTAVLLCTTGCCLSHLLGCEGASAWFSLFCCDGIVGGLHSCLAVHSCG